MKKHIGWKALAGLLALCFILFAASLTQGEPYQEIIELNPDSAYQGESLWVTITGQDTDFGQGSITLVWFEMGSSTISAQQVHISSATQLEAFFQIPPAATPGIWGVCVNNFISPPVCLPSAFMIKSSMAQIISVDPDSAYRGESLTVSITGLNTSFAQGSATTVWFEQGSSTIIASPPNIFSDTYLEADVTIPLHPPTGLWDVLVGELSTHNAVVAPDSFEIKFLCGDANGDSELDISDAVYIIFYIFVAGSPAPDPLESAQVNCDGILDVSDAVWIIHHIFMDTAAPCEC